MFDFTHYLAAKKTVDDRALNRPVLEQLVINLPEQTVAAPLHVLEVAAGIGTMLERLLEWDVLTNVVYTALDQQATYLAEAARRLPQWAAQQGFQVESTSPQQFKLQRAGQYITVNLVAADLFDFMRLAENQGQWDLLIAHAFLDLVDLSVALPQILGLLKPNGLYYFTINFDGETILLPQIQWNTEVINNYHWAMNQPQKVGGTRSGRMLFPQLQAAGAQILAAGSSDWVVYPHHNGYLHEEAYFLHCIIDTIEATLHGKTPLNLTAWLAQRHAQIERGELIYIAHQLDFCGISQPPSSIWRGSKNYPLSLGEG